MTNEQLNIAIAKACGWEDVWLPDRSGLPVGTSPENIFGHIPRYCQDLNAMHEAEEVLTRDQIEVFCEQLLPKHHGIWWGIHTTASQRAEAFLRTIGKWEEAK
jgi:hypothetical protein